MLLVHNLIMLRDIKEQLTRVHSICRIKGKEHPKCKEEIRVLDSYIDQYGKQLTQLSQTHSDKDSYFTLNFKVMARADNKYTTVNNQAKDEQ